MSAVSRRVREFGTLKAMGWNSRRIIRQIMGEALVIGIIGGAAGVAIGYGGAALIQALAPPLTASTASAPASGGPGGRFTHPAPRRPHRLRAPDRPRHARRRGPGASCSPSRAA